MATITRRWRLYFTLPEAPGAAPRVRGYWFLTREEHPGLTVAQATPLTERLGAWTLDRQDEIYRSWEGDGVDVLPWAQVGPELLALFQATVRAGAAGANAHWHGPFPVGLEGPLEGNTDAPEVWED
jgi:hypothetical protein